MQVADPGCERREAPTPKVGAPTWNSFLIQGVANSSQMSSKLRNLKKIVLLSYFNFLICIKIRRYSFWKNTYPQINQLNSNKNMLQSVQLKVLRKVGKIHFAFENVRVLCPYMDLISHGLCRATYLHENKSRRKLLIFNFSLQEKYFGQFSSKTARK